jgi:hypothetical protein
MTIRSASLALALALAAGGLAGCESVPNPLASLGATEVAAPQTFAPVATEDAFRAEVVGREVVYANGAIGTYGADNTWAITDAGTLIASGAWEWNDGRWCYEGTSTTGPVLASCQLVEVSDQSVRFTRADGSQAALPFRT